MHQIQYHEPLFQQIRQIFSSQNPYSYHPGSDKLSPGLPPTHPETTTTSESVWASLLNEREDPRPREETPGREGGC